LGTARLFGIELLRNFAFPYFSKSITEFWRRWHISLSTWFNDYLFTPIVTSTRNWNKLSVALGIMITFFLSGLWHGAGWNFIAYGCLHGAAITYEFFSKKRRKKLFKKLPENINSIISQIAVFSYVTLGFIFFRSKNIEHALAYIARIFSNSIINIPVLTVKMYIEITLILMFMIIEWHGKNEQYAIARSCFTLAKPFRLAFYSIIILAILCFAGKEQAFIYFQF
jgi:alginate O-acetyltransferase complex protein AlgI